jgi:acetyl esterase/lipase/lysophospholipase L1-like esterase
MQRLILLGFTTLAVTGFCRSTVCADAPTPSTAKQQASDVPPTFADIAYGPEKRQRLDFWQAKGDKPTPLIMNIHGGGWRKGEIEPLGRDRRYLDQGISVAHITYRLTPDNPLPVPVMDAARALQFLRSKASEWNIDPAQVIVTGFSAGGCSALWLATHEDLASPNSSDPVERESTCVSGAIVAGAQTTIEPDLVRNWVGEEAFQHPMICNAGGFKNNDELLKAIAGNPETARLYREFSPINHLTADDPPILLEYGPLSPEKHGGIHGAEFGVEFAKQADAVGVSQCYLRVDKDANYTGYPGGPAKFAEMVFKSTGQGPAASSAATTTPGGQAGSAATNAQAAATGTTPRAATPVPRTERSNWMPQHDNYVARARQGNIDVLFFGDSITKGWVRDGRDVWMTHFAPMKAENFGISGDSTQHVLWRLQNRELDNIQPKVVVILIGTNNISSRDAPEDIAQALGAIVGEIRHRSPGTRILLLGILPRRELATDPDRETVRAINRLLSQLHDGDHVTFLDIGDKLLQSDGSYSVEISKDFVHLTPKGYEVFADAIQPTVEALLRKP